MKRPLVLVLVLALALASCSRGGEEPIEPDPEPADEPDPDPEPDPEPDPDPEPGPASPLTGREIDPDLLERPLLLVKVENSPQARPQSGLDAADVVYEEVVEGGITRFFTIFHSELPTSVGPIRSARPIDTQLMSGYGASGFAYSGARGTVRTLLSRTPSVLITEGGAGFHRIRERRAPHNLYLDATQTLQGVVERGAQPIEDVGWVFDEQPPRGHLDCPPSGSAEAVEGCVDPGASIRIRMTNSSTTGWDYDADAGVYRRTQNGRDFFVTGEGRIGADNVVVLATRHYIGTDGYPETDVTTDGADAVVLRDGRRYAARWAKPTEADPLVLLTADGRRFPLKPGTTWLHLPPASSLPTLAD